MKTLISVEASIVAMNRAAKVAGIVDHGEALPETLPEKPFHVWTIKDFDGWQSAQVIEAPNGARFATFKPKNVRQHLGGTVATTGYAVQRKHGAGGYKIADYGRACRYFCTLAGLAGSQ
jgi:hypothetical protein